MSGVPNAAINMKTLKTPTFADVPNMVSEISIFVFVLKKYFRARYPNKTYKLCLDNQITLEKLRGFVLTCAGLELASFM